MISKKKRKNKFKWGFYVLDPYTQDKQFHVKGVSPDIFNQLVKEAMRKYK